jgi:tryptophan synthase alpha chain
MPNRIDNCFARLRSEKRKAFIPYICAGDPNLEKTRELVLALERSGADLIELGIPFSDPLADGVVNQLAAQRALASGATTRRVLDCVRQIRSRSAIPIVLYTYLNPVLQFGFEQFHHDAAAAGTDGLLILDLPPEEDAGSGELECLKQSSVEPVKSDTSQDRFGTADLFHIRLIAPTTPHDRAAKIAANAKGFLYYVSREGVTGARDTIASSLPEKIAQLRRISDLPIAVGFGIANPKQAQEVARYADAVVVGSAIVDLVAQNTDQPDLVETIGRFGHDLANAIHS